jgi:hypothetical protein
LEIDGSRGGQPWVVTAAVLVAVEEVDEFERLDSKLIELVDPTPDVLLVEARVGKDPFKNEGRK